MMVMTARGTHDSANPGCVLKQRQRAYASIHYFCVCSFCCRSSDASGVLELEPLASAGVGYSMDAESCSMSYGELVGNTKGVSQSAQAQAHSATETCRTAVLGERCLEAAGVAAVPMWHREVRPQMQVLSRSLVAVVPSDIRKWHEVALFSTSRPEQTIRSSVKHSYTVTTETY
jgi:hypothetical protein